MSRKLFAEVARRANFLCERCHEKEAFRLERAKKNCVVGGRISKF